MGNQKYETLRLYVLILNVLAWIFALISVIGALYIFSTQLMGSGTTGLSILAFGALSFIGLLAYAQLLNVAMDVESNTSKAAYEMNNLSSLVKKIYEENAVVERVLRKGSQEMGVRERRVDEVKGRGEEERERMGRGGGERVVGGVLGGVVWGRG